MLGAKQIEKKLVVYFIAVVLILVSIPSYHNLVNGTTDIIVDNLSTECTYNGSWITSSYNSGYYGQNYAHDSSSTANPNQWVKWEPSISQSGYYRIYMNWPSAPNRPDTAPLEIAYNGKVDQTKTINQQTLGNQWNLIGTYYLSASTSNYVKLLCSDDGYTVADAVKFEYINPVADTMLDLSQAQLNGSWSNSSLLGYGGSVSKYSSSLNSTCKWETYAPETGNYDIYVYYPVSSNTTKAEYAIRSMTGTWTRQVDQTKNPNAWVKLATVEATKDAALSVTLKVIAGGWTRANMVKYVFTDNPVEEKDTMSGGSALKAIYVNQSGYDLYKPKRATVTNVVDATLFTVKDALDDSIVYTGNVQGQIADFTNFDPSSGGSYYLECENIRSYPFQIGIELMQKVSIYPTLEFMDQSRQDTFNVGASTGYAWRDSHQFSFEMNSLVLQYMANPSAYDRMPYGIYSIDNTEYTDLRIQGEPDIIWLMKFAAERYYDLKVNHGKDLHALIKGQLAYFLYLYPDIKDYVSQSYYEKIRDFTISQWSNPSCTLQWYDIGGASDNNLFSTQNLVGTGKGQQPPGYAIIPNLMMYEVAKRDGLPNYQAYYDAAYNNCKWLIDTVDLSDPIYTKGQRMSEHITMEALAYFQELYPTMAPPGLSNKISSWAELMVSRSNNLWDFRKYDDPNDGVGTEDIWVIPSFNEPGNVAGFMASAYAANRVLSDQAYMDRLEEIAIAQIDNVFGRNPYGRHYSYDAAREIEGCDLGWFDYHHGGYGDLALVPGVLDGSPKEAAYPFNPDADYGYIEGWSAFNAAWNASLAYSAASVTDLGVYNPITGGKISSTNRGSQILIKLKAPLNFDYNQKEAGQIVMTLSDNSQIKVDVVEDSVNHYYFSAIVAAPSIGETVKISYGYGIFKKEVVVVLN